MSKPTAADVGRTCQNCGATKTPVWRTGPSGPKTMCNRCGIKWMRKNPANDRSHNPTSPRKRSNDPVTGEPEGSANGSSSPEMLSRHRMNHRKKKVDDDFDLLIADDEEEPAQDMITEAQSPIKRRKSEQYEDIHTPLSLESNNSSSSCVPMELVSSVPDGHDDSTASIEPEDIYLSTSDDEVSSFVKLQKNSLVNLSISPLIPQLSLVSLGTFRPVVPGPVSPYSTPRHDSESVSSVSTVNLPPTPAQPVDVHRCAQQIEERISSVYSPRGTPQYIDYSLRSNINGSLLRALPRNLQSLNLSRCRPLLDNDLLFLPAQLQNLNVSYCAQLTDESLKHLPQTLTALNVSHCYFTDEGIRSLPMTLTSLDISMCYHITDEGASALPPLLIRLNMEGCKITNEALRNLPSPLQSLNLNNCNNITENGLISLPVHLSQLSIGSTRISSFTDLQYFTNLRHLDLTACEITDDAFAYIPDSVEWLNLFRCGRITIACIERLPSNLEFLNLKSTNINAASNLRSLPPKVKLHV